MKEQNHFLKRSYNLCYDTTDQRGDRGGAAAPVPRWSVSGRGVWQSQTPLPLTGQPKTPMPLCSVFLQSEPIFHKIILCFRHFTTDPWGRGKGRRSRPFPRPTGRLTGVGVWQGQTPTPVNRAAYTVTCKNSDGGRGRLRRPLPPLVAHREWLFGRAKQPFPMGGQPILKYPSEPHTVGTNL